MQHEAVFLCSFLAKVPPAHGEPWEDPFLLRKPRKVTAVSQLVASITIIVSPRAHPANITWPTYAHTPPERQKDKPALVG